MVQSIVVALLVAGCFVYALWTLAPKAPRRRLAAALLKLPVPLVLQKPLTAAVRQQGGCGCDGCDGPPGAKAKPGQAGATQKTQSEFKPVTFVRGPSARHTPRE